MKKLTCEMCGSTDIIKQDGVFVCQVCGCKYSVEEAKKMMVEGTVEVTGTVKVDNTDAIKNYLDMAKNALDAGNNIEADAYCNRIIEMDMKNWEAWYIKGKAVGWQSTLANVRIPETVNAFSKALSYCPEEKMAELSGQCRDEIENLQTALLSTRIKNFNTHPNEKDLGDLLQDTQTILNTSMNFLVKSGTASDTLNGMRYAKIIYSGICTAWDTAYHNYIGAENHPNDYEFRCFIDEGNVLIEALKLAVAFCGNPGSNAENDRIKAHIYTDMIKMQETLMSSQSYEVSFTGGYKHYLRGLYLTDDARRPRQKEIDEWKSERKKVREARELADTELAKKAAEEAKKAFAEAEEKRSKYWKEHVEEKAALDTEKSELQKQIEQLNTRIAELDKSKNEPIAESKKEEQYILRDKIKALNNEYKNLGLFSGKRKKEIQAQLSEAESKDGEIEKEIAAKIAERNAKIKDEQDALREQMNPLYERMAEIDAELAKER